MNTTLKHNRQLVGMAKSWAMTNIPHWDDQIHRDLLARHGAKAFPPDGRVSSTSMDAAQLNAVLDDYAQRGWPRRVSQFVAGSVQGGSSSTRVVKQVPKLVAQIVRLWSMAGTAGTIAQPTRANLLKWCERQTGHTVPDLDSLTTTESQKLITALKAMNR
jgi:hypothetical protein